MTTIQQPLLMFDSGVESSWITTFGRTGGNRQYSGGIDVDDDGNIYWAGQAATSDDVSYPYTDGVKIKLVKFNKMGEHQWSREIGTDSSSDGADSGRGVSVSPDGERVAVVSGSYSNPNGGSGGQPVDSYSGVHVAMYNKSGTIQWQRYFDKMEIEGVAVPYGGSYHDIPEDIYVDSSYNVYVCGNQQNQCGSGVGTCNSNALFFKTNSSGTIQWQKVLHASGESGHMTTTNRGRHESFSTMTVHNGDFYLVGSAQQTQQDYDSNEVLVVKYNSSGSVQWQKRLDYGAWDVGHAIAVDSNNNIYIGGRIGSSNSYAMISKFNSSMSHQWTRQINYSAQIYNIEVDINDNVYAAGYEDSIVTGSSTNDLYIFKLNSSGTTLWSRKMGQTDGSDIFLNYGHGFRVEKGNFILASYGSSGTGSNGGNALTLWKLPDTGSETGNWSVNNLSNSPRTLIYENNTDTISTPSAPSVNDAGLTNSNYSMGQWNATLPEQALPNWVYYKTDDLLSIPNINITTDIASTYSTTAGSGQNFVVAASDNANASGTTITYQWKYSTNSGTSWTDIAAGEGGTSATLTRYATCYYNDSNHQIKCVINGTNADGSNTKDSAVCTLTVNRNWNCNASPTTGTQWNVSGDGLKPSGTNNDETWGNWNPNWSDVCEVGAGMNMRAAGRCGYCETNGVYQGWNMKLQLQIVGGGTVRYYHEQTKSSGQCGNGSHGDFSNFSISSQSWDPSWGSPEFRVQIIADGTNCGGSAGENIFAEQYNNTGKVDWSYRTRTYSYETRP